MNAIGGPVRHEGFYRVDLFDCPPFRMFTCGDDPRAVDILTHRAFEPMSTKIWAELCLTATAILDIGAHVGVYSLIAGSLRKDIPIHAFEPNPYAFARMQVHKLLNNMGNINIHTVALSNDSNPSPFGWAQKTDGWISSGGRIAKAGESVCLRQPLDHYPIHYGPRPIVKIDVEGHEFPVFQGAMRLIEARPTIILESFDQPSCDAISAMLPNYMFYNVIESGELRKTPKLMARNPNGLDYNVLCVPVEHDHGQ